MSTFKDQMYRYNQLNRGVYSVSKDIIESSKYERDNLLIHTESKGHKSFYNKYLLVLGVVKIPDFFRDDEYYYLCKSSNTSIPTMSSKGHYMQVYGLNDINEYKLSIKDTLKNL